MFELVYSAILCGMLFGGETEVSHAYAVGYDLYRIRTDCETADEVFEVGLDKRSSLDSVQQALFAAELTGKTPVVVLVDTDGREGRFELRIRRAAARAGVEYRVYSKSFLIRWRMTSYLRDRVLLADAGNA